MNLFSCRYLALSVESTKKIPHDSEIGVKKTTPFIPKSFAKVLPAIILLTTATKSSQTIALAHFFTGSKPPLLGPSSESHWKNCAWAYQKLSFPCHFLYLNSSRIHCLIGKRNQRHYGFSYYFPTTAFMSWNHHESCFPSCYELCEWQTSIIRTYHCLQEVLSSLTSVFTVKSDLSISEAFFKWFKNQPISSSSKPTEKNSSLSMVCGYHPWPSILSDKPYFKSSLLKASSSPAARFSRKLLGFHNWAFLPSIALLVASWSCRT